MILLSCLIIIIGDEAVEKWYEGASSYDFDHGDFSQETGSFTQLAWKSSRRLGIGIAYGNNRRTAYVVARYLPAGNVLGQFKKNILSTECQSNFE